MPFSDVRGKTASEIVEKQELSANIFIILFVFNFSFLFQLVNCLSVVIHLLI